MLLEGSYLGDVEKVVESFRLIRRDMIRGGEINVKAHLELHCLLPNKETDICPLNRCAVLSQSSQTHISSYHIRRSFILTFFFIFLYPIFVYHLCFFLHPFKTEDFISVYWQINDRVLQNILVAATLPSYGLRSIEKYIEKRFPLVRQTDRNCSKI